MGAAKAKGNAMSEPPPDDAPGNDCPGHGPGNDEECDKC